MGKDVQKAILENNLGKNIPLDQDFSEEQNGDRQIDESILVLEDKLRSIPEENIFKKYITSLQIKSHISLLKALKSRYEIELKNGLTNKTKEKLDEEFRKIKEKIGGLKDIEHHITNVGTIYNQEQEQRRDSVNFMGNLTMRDFVEKNIQFGGILRSVKETSFMTEFYDKFTIKYIDYLDKNPEQKNKHNNLGELNGFTLDKEVAERLVKLSIVEVVEEGINLQDGSAIVFLIDGKQIPIDLKEIIKDDVETIIKHKIKNIEIDMNHSFEDISINKILEFIPKINETTEFLNILKTKYEIPRNENEIYLLLHEKIKFIINEKTKSIENDIVNAKDNNMIKGIKSSINELKSFINELKKIRRLIPGVNSFELIFNFDTLNVRDTENKFNKFKDDLKKVEEGTNKVNSLVDALEGKNILEGKKTIDNEIKMIESLLNNVNVNEYKLLLEGAKDKLIGKLLQIYLEKAGVTEIMSRGDINNPDLKIELNSGIDKGEIDLETMNKIIVKGFNLAFRKEFNTVEGEVSFNNLSRYENGYKGQKGWRKVFGDKLEAHIGRKKAEELFLLVWIESSANPKKDKDNGAYGWFQLTKETARKFGLKNDSDLYDPIKSAEIAANYLEFLLQKNLALGISVDQAIFNSILEYNGNWSNRLLDEKKEDIKKTLYEVYDELTTIKMDILKKQKKYHGKEKSSSGNNVLLSKDIIDRLYSTNSKYFTPGKNHIKILDDLDSNGGKITERVAIKGIDDYLKNIINQQHMYPEQFEAAKQVYEEVKKEKMNK